MSIWAEPRHGGLYPVHGILAEDEGGLEHEEEHEEEDGEAEVAVGEHSVEEVCGAVGVGLRAGGEGCLLECAVDEPVLGVHDGRLAVGACLLEDSRCGGVACRRELAAVLAAVLALHVAEDEVGDVLVVLEELQGQVACGVAGCEVLVELEVVLYVAYAVLDLVAVGYVYVAGYGVAVVGHLDDRSHEFIDSAAALE